MRKILEIRYPYPPYRLTRVVERKRQRKVEKKGKEKRERQDKEIGVRKKEVKVRDRVKEIERQRESVSKKEIQGKRENERYVVKRDQAKQIYLK